MDRQGKYIPHTSTFFGDAGLENEIFKESNRKKESFERKQKGMEEEGDSKKTEWCKTTTVLRMELCVL